MNRAIAHYKCKFQAQKTACQAFFHSIKKLTSVSQKNNSLKCTQKTKVEQIFFTQSVTLDDLGCGFVWDVHFFFIR